MIQHISVIIPVYNRSLELERALVSLVSQTAKNFDVVVCDDGSTEDILAVVSKFEHKLDIQYKRIENSGGPARPRNVAIGLARGEWIAFLDSDDWWDNNRLELVSDSLSRDIDFLYHPLRVISSHGLKTKRISKGIVGEPLKCEANRHFILFGNPVPNSAAVVRLSRLLNIGGICEDKDIIEDYDTWLRLIQNGAKIKFLNKILGCYSVNGTGISTLSKRQIELQINMFHRHKCNFPSELLFIGESCHHYVIGTMQLKLGEDMFSARKNLLLANNLPSFSMRLKRSLKLLMIWRKTLERKLNFK